MYTYKIVIHPNNKQRTKILKTMNKCIECQNIIYDILDSLIKTGQKIPTCNEIRKEFTKIKRDKDLVTKLFQKGLTKKEQRIYHVDVLFYDVSNDALKQTIKDTYNAFMRYFKKLSKYPNRKSYKDNHKSYYMDPYKIEFTENKVKLEKIANSLKKNRCVLNWIKLAEKNRVPIGVKYYNPRVSFDGDRFYLTVSVDDAYRPVKKSRTNQIDKTVGIDLNINKVVTSESNIYTSINNSIKVKKLERKLKRLQRKQSRRYLWAKERKFNTKKNLIKIIKKIRAIYRRLRNIRDDYQYKVIYRIIKDKQSNSKISKVVIETLDIKEMSKNKRISNKIQISSFRKFIDKLKNISNKENITIIEANKYFPSSKKCSKCGNIKKELKLRERIYKCNKCGLVIDRDVNAAINLASYR